MSPLPDPSVLIVAEPVEESVLYPLRALQAGVVSGLHVLVLVPGLLVVVHAPLPCMRLPLLLLPELLEDPLPLELELGLAQLPLEVLPQLHLPLMQGLQDLPLVCY